MELEILHTCSYCGEQKVRAKFLKGGVIAKTEKGKSICTRCYRKKKNLDLESLERKDDAEKRGNLICRKCGEERPPEEFKYNVHHNGRKYHHYCLYCESGLSKEEYIGRKEKKDKRTLVRKELKKISLENRACALENRKRRGESGLEKRCGKCGEMKSVAFFSTAGSKGDGLYGYCMPCAAKEARRRRKECLTVRVAHVLRARLRVAVRKYLYENHISAVRNLGCSLREFVSYIEGLMDKGMSWDNFGNGSGQWCFDHIVPLVHGGFVDISKPDQAIKASHYTNIRPMWTRENLERNGTGRVEDELRSLGLLADDGTVTFPCDKLEAAT